jgi:hypothetical protein
MSEDKNDTVAMKKTGLQVHTRGRADANEIRAGYSGSRPLRTYSRRE